MNLNLASDIVQIIIGYFYTVNVDTANKLY